MNSNFSKCSKITADQKTRNTRITLRHSVTLSNGTTRPPKEETVKTIGTTAKEIVNGIEQSTQSNEVSTASQTQNHTIQKQEKSSLPMKADPQGKKRIGEAVILFHDALKTYGKQPEQMESVTKLFMFALADYPTQKIIDAMSYYVRNYTDFPAPADIVQIIERGNKPPLDRSVYVSISKKHPDQRTSEEWEYMRDYERFQLEG